MLIRTCLVVLTATSLVMLLLPANVSCRDLPVQSSQPKPVGANRQHIPGNEALGNEQSGDEALGDDGAAQAASPKQTAGPIDPRTEQVKRAVRRIGLASKITVFLKNGDDLHGAVSALDQDKFQVAEVDLHQVITVEYKDVKKVRSGYGGINLFTGRHTSQPWWVAPSIAIALLGLLIVPVIFTKD